MGSAFIAQQQRITLRIIPGILTTFHHLHLAPVGIAAVSGRNPLGNNPTAGIVADVYHLRTRIRLLVVVGYRHRIKFTDGTVPLQYRTGIFPRNRRTGLHLCPNQFGILSPADAPLGDKIVNAPLAVLVAGIPVLHSAVFHLGILFDDNLHDSRVQLIFIPHRSRTAFQVADISLLVRHNQRAFKLTGILRIDTEISRQLHRATHPFRDVHKRPVTEHRRIQRRKIIVRVRHDTAQVLSHQVRMIFHRLRERTENNAPLRQRILERGLHRNTVHHRIHGNPGQGHLLAQWNTEFVKRSLQLRIHLLPVLVLFLLRRRIVHDILIIDFRYRQLRPTRHFHGQPFPVSLQTKLQQPFRLLLLGRNRPNHLLVQPLRYRLGLHIRHKTVLILAPGNFLYNIVIHALLSNLH